MGSRSQPVPTTQYKLSCSLEDLYQGVTKRLKVTRRRSANNPQGSATEKILTVEVKPGWKAGTKLTYAGEGDEMPDGRAKNIEIIIEEQSHGTFRRDSHDLHLNLNLSLVEALTGYERTIKTLDGRNLRIADKKVTRPNQEARFPREGMPIAKQPGTKGDLILHFNVEFPRSLTEEQ